MRVKARGCQWLCNRQQSAFWEQSTGHETDPLPVGFVQWWIKRWFICIETRLVWCKNLGDMQGNAVAQTFSSAPFYKIFTTMNQINRYGQSSLWTLLFYLVCMLTEKLTSLSHHQSHREIHHAGELPKSFLNGVSTQNALACILLTREYVQFWGWLHTNRPEP